MRAHRGHPAHSAVGPGQHEKCGVGRVPRSLIGPLADGKLLDHADDVVALPEPRQLLDAEHLQTDWEVAVGVAGVRVRHQLVDLGLGIGGYGSERARVVEAHADGDPGAGVDAAEVL